MGCCPAGEGIGGVRGLSRCGGKRSSKSRDALAVTVDNSESPFRRLLLWWLRSFEWSFFLLLCDMLLIVDIDEMLLQLFCRFRFLLLVSTSGSSLTCFRGNSLSLSLHVRLSSQSLCFCRVSGAFVVSAGSFFTRDATEAKSNTGR